mmetsp:Transcript_23048/g.49074  ORF Transcript_23048/g.49074 Transcript_23048/m.49074 type:complete len:96 (-) Transcript_23048:377-664(-)
MWDSLFVYRYLSRNGITFLVTYCSETKEVGVVSDNSSFLLPKFSLYWSRCYWWRYSKRSHSKLLPSVVASETEQRLVFQQICRETHAYREAVLES